MEEGKMEEWYSCAMHRAAIDGNFKKFSKKILLSILLGIVSGLIQSEIETVTTWMKNLCMAF